MTSTLRLKSGGAWQGPVADGHLNVKVNGAWVSPQYCRIKSDGIWRETGYVGPPNSPTGLGIAGANYSVVHTSWSAPTSGPPIDHYVAAIRDVNGNGVGGQPDRNETGTITYNWSVSPDTRYQFWVRAVGTNGLSSPWVGPVRYGIGHDVSYTYGYVQRTRDWGAGGNIGGAGTINNLAGFAVPSNVICNAVHWQLWASGFDAGGVLSVFPPAYVAGGDRQIEIILNETYVWERPNWPNPLDGWDGANYYGNLQFWGNGGRTGFICRRLNADGSIYGDAGGWGPGRSVVGYVTLGGVEYYNNYEITGTNPAQANYYW